MVDITYRLPGPLSETDRKNFIEREFADCPNGERPCKGLVVDMQNGYYVKIVAFTDVPQLDKFAVALYVKDSRGALKKFPPEAVEAMQEVVAYTGDRFTRSSSFAQVVGFMKHVCKFPATACLRAPLQDERFSPPAYPTMPWVNGRAPDTAARVRLAV